MTHRPAGQGCPGKGLVQSMARWKGCSDIDLPIVMRKFRPAPFIRLLGFFADSVTSDRYTADNSLLSGNRRFMKPDSIAKNIWSRS